MRLSVVIPAYNDAVGVMTCLNSLQAMQATQPEYIVQDDASPDVLLPAVVNNASVQRNPHNLGFAGNCNMGAARATGDILFFVNQDINAAFGWSNGWDSHILAPFARSNVGIVGARLLFLDGSIQSAGGLIDAKGQPFHRCLGYSNPHYHEVNEARKVSWVTGAALAIRRDLFMQVGGFDVGYVGGYFEDVALCVEVERAGVDVWYEPACTLIHQPGSTGGNPKFMQNALRFKQKYVDSGIITGDVQQVKLNYW